MKYNITDQQIDFILHDIRARGVEMESLQQDLLDHICCIIEEKLEANGDFGRFYSEVISSFYRKELREIEAETISLLNNKHYYAMKKIMIISGIGSASLLSAGIIMKFLHLTGASAGIVTGITLFSLLFLPLMFLLKLKEKNQSRDKILLGLGSLVTIMISIGVMFKIMHWPMANMLAVVAVGILLLGYLPVNLISGIRNPDTKVNTIVSSVLLVAGCGLFLSLARSPQGSRDYFISITEDYLRNETICSNELQSMQAAGGQSQLSPAALEIIRLCEQLKGYIRDKETGHSTIGTDFILQQAWLGETYANLYFEIDTPATRWYDHLQKQTRAYGSAHHTGVMEEAGRFLDNKNERVAGALNRLVQVELLVMQSERGD